MNTVYTTDMETLSIPSTEARRTWSEVLLKVLKGQQIIITRNGRKVAVISPIKEAAS